MYIMAQIKDLFPWSAEARILSYLMERKKIDGKNSYFGTEIAKEAKMNVRTVRSKMVKLEILGLVKTVTVFDVSHRKQRAYKLIGSPLTTHLIKLNEILKPF